MVKKDNTYYYTMLSPCMQLVKNNSCFLWIKKYPVYLYFMLRAIIAIICACTYGKLTQYKCLCKKCSLGYIYIWPESPDDTIRLLSWGFECRRESIIHKRARVGRTLVGNILLLNVFWLKDIRPGNSDQILACTPTYAVLSCFRNLCLLHESPIVFKCGLTTVAHASYRSHRT